MDMAVCINYQEIEEIPGQFVSLLDGILIQKGASLILSISL